MDRLIQGSTTEEIKTAIAAGGYKKSYYQYDSDDEQTFMVDSI